MNKKTKSSKTQWLLKNSSILILLAYLLLTPVAMAFDLQPSNGSTTAQGQICGVMGTVHSILKVASVLIVTIAIIFAGYQIAFAHKRIADVAPILIGGLLIGAAGQLAVMVIGSNATNGTGFTATCDSNSPPPGGSTQP